MSGKIHTKELAQQVRVVTIDKAPANAMDADMLSLLLDEFARIKTEANTRAVVLTGTGRYFCSGADLKAQGGEALALFGKLLNAVETCPVPVIGAINGWCVGGGFELALCCDIRLASESAQFICAGVNVGLMASAYRLPRLIGVSRAKHMLLTGSPFTAPVVESYGITVGTYPGEDLLQQAETLASRIASRAPLSVEATKRMSSVALDHDRRSIRELEAEELSVLQNSRDHKEAIKAFAEKRDPEFQRS